MKLLRILTGLSALALLLCSASPSGADTKAYGKVSGFVFDLAGTPQMGATISLTPEALGTRSSAQLLSNTNGIFESPHLRPGFYSLRVTLAGFLPTVQQHVRVSPELTTLVRVQLSSVFSSIDQLRRPPAHPTESGDWKWVLRTSAASRPILQLLDGTVVVANGDEGSAGGSQARARVELANGMIKPGSPSALPGMIGTAVSYDQSLGSAGRLLVAGEMGFDPSIDGEDALSGGIATIWLPSGKLGRGPQTSVILRQVQPAPGGQTIRAVRIDHADRFVLSDHVVLAYGAEFVMGGVNTMTSTVRPRMQLTWQASPGWIASVSLQTDPQASTLAPSDAPLESAIDTLGTTPVLLWRDGRISSLEGAWHEEIALRRKLGSRGTLQAAAFHDFSGHQAVFGFDPTSNADSSSAYAYGHDAGAGGSWGTRVAYRESLSRNFEIAAIYAWAGALTPIAGVAAANSNLSGALTTTYHHSVAGRVAGKLEHTGTQFSASYKWLDDSVVGRQDLFGDAAEGIDPYLSLTIRQPLPSFHLGHWEAVADFRNILAQGYVPVDTGEGRFILMPVERSFQGGVSFQF